MIKLLFDSWRGHTVDNSIVDLDDDAYMVIVLEVKMGRERSHLLQKQAMVIRLDILEQILRNMERCLLVIHNILKVLMEKCRQIGKAGWLWLSQTKIWLRILMISGVNHCQW